MVVVVLVFVFADVDSQHFALTGNVCVVGDVQRAVLTDGDAAGVGQGAGFERELPFLAVLVDGEDRAVAARPDGRERLSWSISSTQRVPSSSNARSMMLVKPLANTSASPDCRSTRYTLAAPTGNGKPVSWLMK
jgi:hypothetical protein